MTDGRTDRITSYDSQDRASIAASRGKKKKKIYTSSGTHQLYILYTSVLQEYKVYLEAETERKRKRQDDEYPGQGNEKVSKTAALPHLLVCIQAHTSRP